MNFGKKIGIYFIGNMASKIMTALLIPIYAFYVTSADLGAYDYSQAIMQIAVPVIYVAIWESILKFVISEEDKGQKNKFLGSAIFVSFISTIIMILFVAVFQIISEIQYPILVCIMMISYTYGMVLQYCSRSLGQNVIYIMSGITAVIVNFLGIVIFVIILRQGLLGLYISYILGQLANCTVSFVKLKLWTMVKYIKPDWKSIKVLLRFSIPMAVNLASGWIINGAGKVVINANLGNEANGIYSYANKFGNLVTMVTNVISMALMEEFYIRMKSDDIKIYFRDKCNQIWELILSIFMLAIPLIGFYFFIIRNTEYYVALSYVPLCIMTACFSSFATNVGGVFQIKDIMHYAFLTTLAGGVVTIVIAVLSIDAYGIIGVVLAQMVGSFVLVLSRYCVAHKFLDYSIRYFKTIIFLCVITMESYIVTQIQNLWIDAILFLINMAIVILVNKEFIKLMFSKLKTKLNK